MRKASFLLAIFSFAATAQRPEHERLVARLNSDLMAMQSVKGSPEDPLQARIMVQFETDINTLHPVGFVTRSLAYALTSAIAGRDLSDAKLTPLVEGLIASYGSALLCKANSCNLLSSVPFRASIEQTYSALANLGVSVPEAQHVMRLVDRAADRVIHAPSRSIVRPIPPG